MTAKPLINVSFTQVLAVIGILMVGFIGGIFVNSATNLVRPSLNVSEVNPEQKIEAESARYTGLAEFYNTDKVAEQARDIEAARYSGLATYYGADNQQAIEAEVDRFNGLATYYGAENQRAIEAEVSRYTGLAMYYGVENQRAIEAEVSRYSGLATYYGAANQRAIEAEAARYSGLATVYASELLAANPELMKVQSFKNETTSGPSLLDADPAWLLKHRSAEVRAIGKTHLMAANPELMVAQHYPAVPMKNEVDPNLDLGLLEFFTPQTNQGVSEINPLPAIQPEAITERQKIETILLSENPELIKVRSFAVAQVEWNRLHPGR